MGFFQNTNFVYQPTTTRIQTQQENIEINYFFAMTTKIIHTVTPLFSVGKSQLVLNFILYFFGMFISQVGWVCTSQAK